MTICSRCNHTELTWSEQRREFARLIQGGFTPEEAKQHMPLCGKCVTMVVRENGRVVGDYRSRRLYPSRGL